jgi:hypothetical protein
MTYNEVVNKLSMEMALALGDMSALQTCRTYIQMALSIGTEHFTKDMDEVIAYTTKGKETGRFKSVQDAANKLGLYPELITAVLNGRQCTTGGFMFMKTKDKELGPVKNTA